MSARKGESDGGNSIKRSMRCFESYSDWDFDCEVEKVNVGRNIKAMRQRAGLQQAELAEKVGVSQSMICQIERGTKACSIQLGADIAEVLGCGINDLLTTDDQAS